MSLFFPFLIKLNSIFFHFPMAWCLKKKNCMPCLEIKTGLFWEFPKYFEKIFYFYLFFLKTSKISSFFGWLPSSSTVQQFLHWYLDDVIRTKNCEVIQVEIGWKFIKILSKKIHTYLEKKHKICKKMSCNS